MGITNLISKWAGKLTKSNFSKGIVPLFIRHYGIDGENAEKPIKEYSSLNDFFTRKLKVNERKIDTHPTSIVSPVDGMVAQVGKIEKGTLIQAKGIHYTLKDLILCKEPKLFEEGSYMTIYLSPKDYHRIHSPLNGKIEEYEYIPGTLFPVNSLGVKHVKGLFTKNERLTTFFKTEKGHAALVKVGAFIVGSVQIAYEKNVHQNHRGKYYVQDVKEKEITIEKGEELGWFEFGSTVILLLDKEIGSFSEEIKTGAVLKMGNRIGTLR